MKKIITIILFAISINAHAQFTLEATYDTASTDITTYGLSQLMVIDFELSGERYVKINRLGKLLSIYDMNHVLVKNIPLPFLPANTSSGTLLYISQQLFDLDDKIEFMYIQSNYPNSGSVTSIYNEDGTVLFSEPGSPLIQINVLQQQYPIYNTSQGTKMILSYQNGQAKVFGLQGVLTEELELKNNSIIANAYPNPAMFSTRIDYSFPKGITQGCIVFYDMEGREIKRFNVDNTFDHIMVSTVDIATGTYYYQVQTTGKSSEGKKLVVVK